MKLNRLLGTAALAAGLYGTTVSGVQAADLEFYFPVGVNAPAVETIQEMVDAWDEAHPEHTVKAVYAGNYEETTTKALTAAQAGNAPDVAVLLAIDIFTLVEEDVVAPFSQMATSEEDKAWMDSFIKGFTVDTVFGGETYSIPFQRSTPIFYYNKDAFREAGLDPEKAPESWAEMIEIGKKLVKKDDAGNVVQWGTRVPNLGLAGLWLLGGMVYSMDGTLTTDSGTEVQFNTDATLSAISFLKSLAEEGIMQPGGVTWGDTPKAFIEGNTASMWTSSGNLAFVNDNAEFEWGTAFLPGGNHPGASLGGGNFYIFKDTSDDEKAAALDLVKFMTSPENAAKWAISTGYVATSEAAWETAAIKDYTAQLPQALVARDQLPYAYREVATFQRKRVAQIMADALEAIIAEGADPKASLANAQSEVDKILADYN
ncbi:MAG: ABC transporter substrate-binding protein [Alphaproteobacteria bacterium MedPE-SWcel]|nr:MAG: ABC transporter substrate-binding protein [Alphaproteobacteria bacterium MedPE-SWcel]